MQQPLDCLTVSRLSWDDLARIEGFVTRCTDFFVLIEGAFDATTAAHDLLQDVPPGIDPGKKHVFAWEAGGEIAAVVDLIEGYPADRDWYVSLFLLAPERRGQGLGRTLWAEAEGWIRRAGGRTARLIVQHQNPAARRFWEAAGFAVEGETVQILPHRENPIWKLRKEIGAPSLTSH